MRCSISYYALLSAVFLWCAALVVLPLAASAGFASSRIGYDFFSNICHQEGSRSLHIAGHPMGVCERCSGIYFGFLAGVLLSRLVRKLTAASPRILWGAAVAPMLIDVAADISGIHASTAALRLFSGGFFGIAAALILTPLLVEALSSASPPKQLTIAHGEYEPKT